MELFPVREAERDRELSRGRERSTVSFRVYYIRVLPEAKFRGALECQSGQIERWTIRQTARQPDRRPQTRQTEKKMKRNRLEIYGSRQKGFMCLVTVDGDGDSVRLKPRLGLDSGRTRSHRRVLIFLTLDLSINDPAADSLNAGSLLRRCSSHQSDGDAQCSLDSVSA